MGRVKGKVAFITGAARGQGRSHAVRFAEEGAAVIAIDVCKEIPGMGYPPATPDDLEETARRVEESGGRILAEQADIRNFDELRGVLGKGVERFGGLDIVAANAGIGSMPYPAHEIPDEIWRDMVEITLTGTWNTCRAAIPHMLEGGRGGAIVITSSAASLRGYANITHYTAAKHGVLGLVRALASELGPHNIRVTNIAPTQVGTDMILNEETYKLFRPDKESPTREDFAEVSEGMHLLPVPWLEPEDVSNAVLFLASDEARYITGTTLAVDAGVTQH